VVLEETMRLHDSKDTFAEDVEELLDSTDVNATDAIRISFLTRFRCGHVEVPRELHPVRSPAT
jgi:hypothetical protein